MALLRSHNVVQTVMEDDPGKKTPRISFCLRHPEEQLKYFCKRCQEAVCCDCLLLAHKDHQYSTVADARLTLGERLEASAILVSSKKEEFEAYLEELKKIETTEMESSERMKVEVDKIFDAIVAAVEAQRNEALQTVSQRLKEIWAQKELIEVSLAQLDSFTRFTDHTKQCFTDSVYVSMATQGMKLMEQLKGCHGNKGMLEHQFPAIGSQSLDGPLNISLGSVFQLSHQPSVKLTPPEEAEFDSEETRITISLEVGGLPVSFMTHTEGCELHAQLVRSTESDLFSPALLLPIVSASTPNLKANKTGLATWEVTEPNAIESGKYRLKYTLTGGVEMVAEAVYYVRNSPDMALPDSVPLIEDICSPEPVDPLEIYFDDFAVPIEASL